MPNPKLNSKTQDGPKKTRQREPESNTAGRTALAPDLPATSSTSGEPLKVSKKNYETPTNARELAVQANQIATMILNGEINLDIAAKYSSIIRATSQLLSLEVAKARMDREKIDLNL
jgi:hypothetical protein